MGKKVLVVDDEKNIVDILCFHLQREGYTPIAAYDGEEGLRLALAENPDLILLDVMLPYMDGFEVCRRIRWENSLVPIIMLTAREEERDKVFGLELGADDYVTKPFLIRELMARVKTNIRRSAAGPASGHVLRAGSLVIDLDKHAVTLDGESVELSQREYELLKFLASEPGKVCTREELMQNVWQYDYYGDVRTVDVAVRRLREKVEKNPAEPEHIFTKRGVGYYFEA